MFLFVGLTVGLAVVATSRLARPCAPLVLLGLELGQGLIGFVQYFTDLPIVLVGFHLLGAALISARDDVGAARDPGARARRPAGNGDSALTQTPVTGQSRCHHRYDVAAPESVALFPNFLELLRGREVSG